MNENGITIQQVLTLVEQLMQAHANAVNQVNSTSINQNLRFQKLGEANALLGVVNTIMDMLE